MNTIVSLLYPSGDSNYKKLSDISMHDLGIDFICENVTDKVEEQTFFYNTFAKMSDSISDTKYR